MSSTTLHFVRHGKVENPGKVLYERLPGFHLSQLGQRQVQATARYIVANSQMNRVTAVYSSPLDRTRETAAAVLNELNQTRAARGEAALDLHTDERIIEAGNDFRGTRIGYGQGALWRPRNLKLIRNLWRPSWGESYRSIASRVSDFAQEMVQTHEGEQVIVVSHESPIWSYRHLLETGRPEHNMLLRHTDLASITSITYDGSGHVEHIAYANPAKDVQ